MKVTPTALPDVIVFEPARHGDARGFFSECWNKARMAEHGVDIDFVQDNHSLSSASGTVRGLHFQAPPYAQAKLVRVVGMVRSLTLPLISAKARPPMANG